MINRDAIHFACASGHADLVQILAVDFAQSGNEDDRQRTPLHYAVDYERLDIVKDLVVYEQLVDKKDADVLLVLTESSIRIHNAALHLCAIRGNVSIGNVLVDNGASVNATNSDDWTPLHYAIRYGRIPFIEFLLSHGASLNKKSKGVCFSLMEFLSNSLGCIPLCRIQWLDSLTEHAT